MLQRGGSPRSAVGMALGAAPARMSAAALTALSSRNIGYKLFLFFAVSLVFTALSPLFESDSEEAIDALNSLMAAGLFFLLGPYVGNAVQRWWAVRKDCVGGLWGAVDDLSTYAAAWFWRDTPADREARALVRSSVRNPERGRRPGKATSRLPVCPQGCLVTVQETICNFYPNNSNNPGKSG